MHSVNIVLFGKVVFQTKPTKLMSTWARHVRAPRYSLNRNLTFGTFIGKKNEINNVLPLDEIMVKKDSLPMKTSVKKDDPEENIAEEDSDDWGAVPAFLRRRK